MNKEQLLWETSLKQINKTVQDLFPEYLVTATVNYTAVRKQNVMFE